MRQIKEGNKRNWRMIWSKWDSGTLSNSKKDRMFIENTRIISWFDHLITFNWISLIDKFKKAQCIYVMSEVHL